MRGITLVVALWVGVLAPAWAEQEKALFAGGCFWCMEAAFQERQGVLDVVSGFTGGALANPSYAGNHSGHFEAIEVTFDPDMHTTIRDHQNLKAGPDGGILKTMVTDKKTGVRYEQWGHCSQAVYYEVISAFKSLYDEYEQIAA